MSEKTRQVNNGLSKRCGCPHRAWPKCSHAWHLRFTWRGVRSQISLDRHAGRPVDSRTLAETEAEKIRIEIRAGTFGQPAPRAEMTLAQLATLYLERDVRTRHPDREREFRRALETIGRSEMPVPTGGRAPLGDWRLCDIVTDTIERFREIRTARGLGVVGTNRLLGHLRAMVNWALRAGYLESSAFVRAGQPVVKLAPEHPRSRRLDPDTNEEGALLSACQPHLRAVVETALETGMRRGEILSLQWSQVDGVSVDGHTVKWAPRAALVLPWSKTKTRKERRIPISTRLRAILELRRFDPAGQPQPPDAFVFGNEIGQRVRDVGRAWETAMLKAHGIAPALTTTANLTPTCRAALAQINLRFHDLRREAGSRWLEGGVPIHVVRDWLGHTSIEQTSTYLAGSVKVQHDAMAAYEARRAAAPVCTTKGKAGGRKSPRSATGREKKPNKTAVGREAPIM